MYGQQNPNGKVGGMNQTVNMTPQQKAMLQEQQRVQRLQQEMYREQERQRQQALRKQQEMQREIQRKQAEYASQMERQRKQALRQQAQVERMQAKGVKEEERFMTQQQREMEKMQKAQFKEYQQAMHVPKLTTRIAEEYLAQCLGVPVQNIRFIRIGEIPDTWKHACMNAGVVLNPANTVYYANTPIIYTLCGKCGALHYHFEGADSEIKIANNAFVLGANNEQLLTSGQTNPSPYSTPDGAIPNSQATKGLGHIDFNGF